MWTWIVLIGATVLAVMIVYADWVYRERKEWL